MTDTSSSFHDDPPTLSEFMLPTFGDVGATAIPDDRAKETCVYLCGNSLGALTKRSQALVLEELDVWRKKAVNGHFDHPHGREWMNIADFAHPLLAEIVGAKENEVACMSTLTANLHLMINTFYRPIGGRYKILCEGHAFPSDQYAFASQLQMRGMDPADALIELFPRPGEFSLREADILECIEKRGHEIALVLFAGVQYYTGQWFPMEKITRVGKEAGCTVGWDLAHAVGNVPMSLHDWDVDFAVWCSYKYLNSGPGGIAGLFIHEKWNDLVTKYAGWWGHDQSSRFKMPPTFKPIRGAQGFQQSNPSVLATVSLLGSLQVFHDAGGVSALRQRSLHLTGTLEKGLEQSKHYLTPSQAAARYPSALLSATSAAQPGPLPQTSDNGPGSDEKTPSAAAEKLKPAFTIITPSDPASRGAQLSLLIFPVGSGSMQRVFDGLKKRGVVGDERQPDVIRLAPVPLYNSESDVRKCLAALEDVFDELS